MLKIIVIVVIMAVAILLIVAATKPNSFQVQRTVTIQASPEKIFALINSLKAMSTWSPYEKLDPNMQRSYSGPDAGPGAAYEWQGNNKAGAGRLEIIDSSAPSKVVMKLDMYKPIAGSNTVDFSLLPNGGNTQVTWAMHGPSRYVSKVITTLGLMDKMVGGQFEEGLSNLKRLAESR